MILDKTENANSVCPHQLTGLCDDKEVQIKCGHSKFHIPIECFGATCRTRQGVCKFTDLYVTCESVTTERRKQLEKFINLS